MTDIHQWRRKIYPRSKTPTPTLEQEERFTNTAASTSSTPRRRSRPRLTSLLSSHGLPSIVSASSLLSPERNLQPALSNPYDPDVMLMAQIIMTKLSENHHEGLTPNYNSQVMHIIEAYRNTAMENATLKEKVKQLGEDLLSLKSQLGNVAERLVLEQADSRTDVKRPETLITTTSTGLDWPTSAQEARPLKANRRATATSSVVSGETSTMPRSSPNSPQLEGHEDEGSVPKALMIYPSIDSPTTKALRRASKSLITQALANSSPPEYGPAAPAMLQRFQGPRSSPRKLQRKVRKSKSASLVTGRAEVELSEDNYSTFSSNGDAFSDEVSNESPTLTFVTDKDFDSVRHLAEVMARRHGIELNAALSKLTDVFFTHDRAPSRLSLTQSTVPSRSAQFSLTTQVAPGSYPPHSWQTRALMLGGLSVEAQLLSKPSHPASNKQRLHRPFSFDIGDDHDLDIVPRRRADLPDVGTGIKENLPLSHVSNVSDIPTSNPQASTAPMDLSELDAHPAPPPTIRQSSSGSQIPISKSRPTMRRTREDSTSSIETTVHLSPANPQIPNCASRPSSVRTSSLQSIMSGLRANRYTFSAASSTGHSSNSSSRRNIPGCMSQASLLSDEGKVTAVAAARAAGDRRGSQQLN